MISIDEIVIADDAAGWSAAGFTVDNDDIARVGRVRLRFVGRRGSRGGMTRWSVRELGDVDALDGLPTERSVQELADPAEHANTAVLVDHVVIATPDVDRTVGAFLAEGCEPRRERRAENSGVMLRQVFLCACEVVVEIVGPPEPPNLPVYRDRPASLWGLALSTRDLDAAAQCLGPGLGAIKDAVQPGRRIATLDHEQFGISVPIAFMSE